MFCPKCGSTMQRATQWLECTCGHVMDFDEADTHWNAANSTEPPQWPDMEPWLFDQGPPCEHIKAVFDLMRFHGLKLDEDHPEGPAVINCAKCRTWKVEVNAYHGLSTEVPDDLIS